jgi:hypothetical protein
MSKGAFLIEMLKKMTDGKLNMILGAHILLIAESNIQPNRSKKNHTIPIAASGLK